MKNEDVEFEIVIFNFGQGDKNPIENARFYNKHDPNNPIEIEQSQVSGMLPNIFEDTYLRIYSKNRDNNTITTMSREFKEWCEKEKLPVPFDLVK